MISDTLSDASHAIREYLTHPATAPCYDQPCIRREVEAVLAHMERVRVLLDSPAGVDEVGSMGRVTERDA